jgi:hypothetical protein
VRLYPALAFFQLAEALGELNILMEAAVGTPDAGRALPATTRVRLEAMLKALLANEHFGQSFPYSRRSAERMDTLLRDPEARQWKLSEALRDLCARIEDELSAGLHLEVNSRYRDFCMRPGHDWLGVSDAFPDAHIDIHQASQCIALERFTAAVFHLMRTLEHGLRDIAAQFGISFTDRTWYPIIRDIEAEIAKRKRDPKGLSDAEKADLAFYSDIAVEFKYFKDAWRNHVSHAKSTYDAGQAEAIYVHVRDFMLKISDRRARTSEKAP